MKIRWSWSSKQFPFAAGEYVLSTGLTRPSVEWLYRSEHFALLPVEEVDVFRSGHPLNASYSIFTVPHRWVMPEALCQAVRS